MATALTDIRAIISDVDGVLTDGTVWHDGQGEALKPTNARDGYLIKAGRAQGLQIGLCSGRRSAALETRAAELRCEPCLLGVADKVAVLAEWLDSVGLAWEQVAFVGDDLPDWACMQRAGLGVAVADASPALRMRADIVLHRSGGRAALAECIEMILRAQGLWAWKHEPGVHG